MQYNVSQLIKEPTGSKRTYEINDDSKEMDDVYSSDIQGRMLLTKTDIGIWVQGSVHVCSESECVRCLVGFLRNFEIKLDAQFYPLHSASDERFGIEDSFTFDSNNILDISDVFRQSIITGASMKPLCSDNCLGLCQSCGKNMNYDECSCVDSLIDIHWNDLSRLVNLIGIDSVKV